MTKKESFKAKEVIDALENADGYVSKAASLLGCTSMTVYNYAKRYQTVRAAWDSIKEKRHDFVENALHKQIKEGNVTAIIFYLKTQCKRRGYVERHEVTGSGGDVIEIAIKRKEPD
jgi:predicted transcriptional regulator